MASAIPKPKSIDDTKFLMSSPWAKKIMEYRDSNNTNVFAVPTMDRVRWGQVIKLGTHMAFPEGTPLYIWNMAEGRVVKHTPVFAGEKLKSVEREDYYFGVSSAMQENGRPASFVDLIKMPAPNIVPASEVPFLVQWKVIAALMRREKATVVAMGINFVGTNKEQLDVVMNYLAGAVAKDSQVFKNKSTLLMIVPSTEYLSEGIKEVCAVVDPPISTPEERERLINTIIYKNQLMRYSHATTEAEKKKIIDDYKKLEKQVTKELINAGAGLTLDDVESATLLSLSRHNALDVEVFKEYKIEYLKKYGIEYVEPKYGFEAVGGYEHLKEYINDMIYVIQNPEIAMEVYGRKVPRGMILHGLPGTGKTWFSNALAKELAMPVIKLSPADFMRGIVGETEARVKQITRIIDSLSPVLVFIDEIDQMGLERSSVANTDSGASRRMLNMLLDWLGQEDRSAIVVGATNHFEHMDKAFTRSGRFDVVVYVPPPDLQSRREILDIHMLKVYPINTKKIKFDADRILWEVAKKTELWTGAELRLLCERVKAIAMKERAKEITLGHFQRAMESMHIDMEQRRTQIIKDIAYLENKAEANVDMDYLKKVKRLLGLTTKAPEIKGDERIRSVRPEKAEEFEIGDDLGFGF